MNMYLQTTMALGLVGLTVLAGCRQPASEAADVPVAPQGTVIGEMVAAWEAGNKDEAARQFRAIDWSAPEATEGVALLNISESEFQSLSAAQRTDKQAEAIELLNALRGVARHVIDLADEAQNAGDEESAQAGYDSVGAFGKTMASPDRLQLFQMVGKAYEKVGEQKRSEVRGRGPEIRDQGNQSSLSPDSRLLNPPPVL